MGYNHVKQAAPREICNTANASEDSTLIGTTNLTQAYRKANLADNQIKLNEFTNGAFVSLCSQVDGDTGTFELWGYPDDNDDDGKFGIAQLLGEWTYVTDACKVTVNGVDYYYVDAFTDTANTGPHTTTNLDMADGCALIKFDTLGFKYIVALVTVIDSSDADGIARVFLRPW